MTFRPATGTLGARRRLGQLVRRGQPWCVTAGVRCGRARGNGAAGSGPRRCALALEAAAQAAPPSAARLPAARAATAWHSQLVHRVSMHVSRIAPRARPGPSGPARRRCALEAVESCNSSCSDGCDQGLMSAMMAVWLAQQFSSFYLLFYGAVRSGRQRRADRAARWHPCDLHPCVDVHRGIEPSYRIRSRRVFRWWRIRGSYRRGSIFSVACCIR